jgi:2-hydroxy-6-oxonona-2,4-dienedioate hydrolase
MVPSVRARTLEVEGRAARVFVGGAGERVLLVHGGWGGAELHWSPVWDRLAVRFQVIAPDLPGIGTTDQPALRTVTDYARWLAAMLDALELPNAWCVGNSFGASVVWSLAGRAPARCAGVVLVDGIPMPRTPAPLRILGKTRAARGLMRRLVRRISYSRAAVGDAFADPAHAPADLERRIAEEWPVILPRFVDLLIAGDGPPAPTVSPLLLWGADDRLRGSTRRDADHLHARLRGSTLRRIEHAGHFPQVEEPAAFVAALDAFVG